LAQVPISVALREGSDRGEPVVATNSEDASAAAIIEIADGLLKLSRGLVGRKLNVSPRA
jgi:ATP-binding protein involved in chromosome partitioning